MIYVFVTIQMTFHFVIMYMYNNFIYNTFSATSKPIRSGYMLFSDGRLKWKKVFVVLFQDSTFAWFDKPKKRRPIGFANLQV